MKFAAWYLHALRFFLLFTALTLSAWAQQSTAPKRLMIHHHERVPGLQLDALGAPPATQRTPRGPQDQTGPSSLTLSFDAMGKNFRLELESNHELIADLPSAQQRRLAAKAKLYRGKLSGVENSWIRLTQMGSKLSGVIWDGTEIYVIDSSDEVAEALATGPLSNQPYNLVYRLKDAVLTNVSCGLDGNAKPLTDFGALSQELKALAEALPATTRELSVAIVADTQFVQANAADPEAAVVARMNVVDGIYSNQIGVHLKIAQIRALQNNGTLVSTDAGTLLSQFSNFAIAPGFTNPGIAHLFTARDMNGNVIGIAFLASLCNRQAGVGISETRGTGTGGALIVAHEIGHNFGAPHDNQSGSACASTPNGFIMNPSANGSDQFSACSIAQMQPVIARAGCIASIGATPDADLRPVLPVNPINAAVGASLIYRVEVRNSGAAAATSAAATIAVPNGLQLLSSSATQGACTNSATQVTCNLGSIAAAATSTVTLSLRAPSAGQFTSNVTVSAANDGNTANNTVQATINIGNNGAGATLFESHFDTGADGFAYVDNAFRGASQSSYASGLHSTTGGFSGGGLRVTLGGLDDADILNMSGGWNRGFTLASQQRVTASLRIRLEQSANYESDEFSQALLAIDGRLASNVTGRDYLVQVRGNGNGGPVISSGWQQISVDLGVLPAGSHNIAIGGFNNKKTFRDEQTNVYIDDVVLKGQ